MNKSLSLLPVMFQLLKRSPKRTAVVLVCQIFAGLLEGVGIAAVLPIFSLLFSGGSPNSMLSKLLQQVFDLLHLPMRLEFLLLFVVVAFAMKALMLFLAAVQMGFATAYIAKDLRLGLIRSFARANWPYFVRSSAGAQTFSVTTEAQKASIAYTESCQLVAASLRVAVYILFSMMVSWKVAVAAMMCGGGAFVLLGSLVRMARRAGERQVRLFNRISSRLSDGLSGMKVLKAMGCEDSLFPLLQGDIKSLMKAQRTVVISKHGLNNMHELLLVVLVCAGMFLFREQMVSDMDVAAVLLLLFAKTLREVNVLQKIWHKIAECAANYLSILKKTEEAAEHRDLYSGKEMPSFNHSIAFSGVTFSYSAEREILRGVDLDVKVGSMVSIVGPSGTGKTTFIDLIAGLLQPELGKICVDGVPLQNLDMKQWRRMIGYVQQENKLFHDTLLSNITMGEGSPDMERVGAVLKMADAWGFVSDMEEGVHTIAGEGGARLSGGQRQRIAIARALYHSQKLLLLDEVTASLDEEAEAEICRVIASLKGMVTVVAISHQAGMMEIADQVYQLKNGKLNRVEST